MGIVLDFHAITVQPQNDFEVLPAGWYTATITGTEQRIAKSGNGEYLEIELTIAFGAHEGRKVWDRLNLWNSSERAVRNANITLTKICSALNIAMPLNDDQLLNQQLDIKLWIRKSEQYRDSNEVSDYRQKQNAIQPAPDAVAPVQQPTAAPWQK